MFRRPWRAVLINVVPVALCCLALGCGGSTTRVSGKVTFKGAPVPSGKIYFRPDTSKGNNGPTGYADIKDGSFDTSSSGGAGASPGAVIVEITGVAPTGGDGDVTAKQLFYPYSTTADLPKGSHTQSFDVPADAEKAPKQTGKPIIVP